MTCKTCNQPVPVEASDRHYCCAQDMAQKKRIEQLEILTHKLHLDLLARAEQNSDGEEVVNISSFLWDQICEVVAEAEE